MEDGRFPNRSSKDNLTMGDGVGLSAGLIEGWCSGWNLACHSQGQEFHTIREAIPTTAVVYPVESLGQPGQVDLLMNWHGQFVRLSDVPEIRFVAEISTFIIGETLGYPRSQLVVLVRNLFHSGVFEGYPVGSGCVVSFIRRHCTKCRQHATGWGHPNLGDTKP